MFALTGVLTRTASFACSRRTRTPVGAGMATWRLVRRVPGSPTRTLWRSFCLPLNTALSAPTLAANKLGKTPEIFTYLANKNKRTKNFSNKHKVSLSQCLVFSLEPKAVGQQRQFEFETLKLLLLSLSLFTSEFYFHL